MILPISLFMSSHTTFNTLVESHEVISKENYVGVQGLALPFEQTSRNGFRYITESIRQAFQSMIGKPVLFNHDPDKVIGHVEDVSFDETGMTYRMNVGEDGPFGWVANKLRRGDLKNVSIQCLYDEESSYMDEDGTMNAWVKEFLELSVVTIPGFADTTAQVFEKFKAKEEKKMSDEEKPKQEDVVEPSEPQDEKPVVDEAPVAEEAKEAESSSEAVDDNEDEEEEDKASEEEDRLGNLEKQVASLRAELDDMKKGDDEDSEEACDSKESDDEEEEPEEDKEKKVEEAIRNDKQSISTEQLQEETRSLSSEDLKELYGKYV